MSDLDRLIKAVEAGTWDGDMRMPAEWHPTYIIQSYYGSFDAALSLRGALLLGWEWVVGSDGEEARSVVGGEGKRDVEVDHIIPARALLLAVLKAYRETIG